MQKKMNFSGTKCVPQPPEGLKLNYRKRANSEAIFAVLVSQNCVNDPQIKYIRPGYNLTVLVGAFGGHFEPFWAIFGPFWSDFSCQSKRLGQFGANFSPFMLFKTA